MGDNPKCPDCYLELKEVVIEKYMLRSFVVDHEAKRLIPKEGEDWGDCGERVLRCPECDTLNVNDGVLSNYTIKEI